MTTKDLLLGTFDVNSTIRAAMPVGWIQGVLLHAVAELRAFQTAMNRSIAGVDVGLPLSSHQARQARFKILRVSLSLITE